jgi:hypothetical protein
VPVYALTLEAQAGQQIVDIILTGYNVFPFIGMNLRTFTPGRVNFVIFFIAKLLVVVFDAGETVYLAEVEGFSVVDLAGEVIGEVCGFSSNTSQDLIIVQTPKGRALIPFIEPFLLNIDFDKREVRMDLPPGLIDLEENR